jgi:glutamate-5-semialdehyde dehydrogenase
MTSVTVRAAPCLELPETLLVGGNKCVAVDQKIRETFRPGDKLLTVLVASESSCDDQPGGDEVELLLVPNGVSCLVGAAVGAAVAAGSELRLCTDAMITDFFQKCASLLQLEDVWQQIEAVNATDVAAAVSKGRSTTRLAVSASMRAAMIEGLLTWANKSVAADCALTPAVEHVEWTCSTFRRELGTTAFVFEGRPNVVVDAVGVLRYRNTVVMRIGSDALATASAVLRLVVEPALGRAGLPVGCVQLLPSPSHAAGWALFSDSRVGLAVARGSGRTVRILGSIAASHGIPTSLHGKGGAWGIISPAAFSEAFLRDVVGPSIVDSLDRKVCNTLNTILIPAELAASVIGVVLDALDEAARRRNTDFRLHFSAAAAGVIPEELKTKRVTIRRATGMVEETQATPLGPLLNALGREWEWENAPEVTVHVVEGGLGAAIDLFNRFSPKFVVSLWSPEKAELLWMLRVADAPFVGDRHTRWVDGQKALRQPELGLCNWESGKLLSRSGILTGADVGTYVLAYQSNAVAN